MKNKEPKLLRFIGEEPNRQLAKNLYRLIGSASLQYSTKPQFTSRGTILTEWPKDHTYAKLRDSIAYRANCISYHYNILQYLFNTFNAKAKASYLSNAASNALLDEIGDGPLYIFDDIIFHSVSIFDYVSSFIAFPYVKSDALSMNWNKLVKRCRHDWKIKDKSLSMNDRAFSFCVVNSQDTFLDKLQRYRGQLYHHKKDSAGYTLKRHLGDSKKSRVIFDAPVDFLSVFSEEFSKYDPKTITLLGVSAWVHNTCLTIANEIANLFWMEVAKISSPEPFYKKWNRMMNIRCSISLNEITSKKSKKLNVKPARRKRKAL